MNENPVLKIDAPDRHHRAALTYAGEVRHGPWYYTLAVDDLTFPARIFGSDYLWSENSRYFVIQEWHSTDYNRGPLTGLMLVDVIAQEFLTLVPKISGFVRPVRFGENLFYYRLTWSASGKEVAEERGVRLPAFGW